MQLAAKSIQNGAVTITPFFHNDSATLSYVVADKASRQAAIIDPVLDYDQDAARFSQKFADNLIDYITKNQLHLTWILETHIHADHVTAAHYIRSKLGGKIAIAQTIEKVIAHWQPIFSPDGGGDLPAFDHYFAARESFAIGDIKLSCWHTPGHTPACASYVLDGAVFVGDTLFRPDYGTARVDFPGGSAAALYQSIQALYELPEDTLVCLCHDYPSADSDPQAFTTIGAEASCNILLKQSTSLDEFVAERTKRDKTLDVPRLILPSLQMNCRLGQMPPKAANGISYLHIPLNLIG